jgi:uncharacterized repeat protein (TIGR01451 family)
VTGFPTRLADVPAERTASLGPRSCGRFDSVLRRGWVALATSLVLLAITTPAHALGTFTRHVTITVGAGVVGGAHADFPTLVDVANADLRTTANGGSVQSASGFDIVFRGEDAAICGGPATCMLDHELELYDGAAGRVLAWVRVPSLANGRVLHMYYGNSRIASSTEATGAVFDADYVGVWHLKESGNGNLNEYRDSSRYGNHGQGGQGDTNAVPKQVSGKIGYAQHFDNLVDSTYDFVDAGQDGTLNITGNQLTLEAWVRHNITPNTAHGCSNPPYSGNCSGGGSTSNEYGILNHKGYQNSGAGYRFFLDGDQLWCPGPSGALTDVCLGAGLPEAGINSTIRSSQYGPYPYTGPGSADPVTKNAWHHVATAYDGAEIKLYVDGVKLRAEAAGVYSTGNATVTSGANFVTFAGGASLPGTVAPGDVLTFTGATVENLVVASVVDTTHVTLTTSAGASHVNQSYRITSPFKSGNINPSLWEQHTWIGHGDQPQNVGWSGEFEGDIDEVRISRVARSDDWIATEYANQGDPAAFASAGAPEAVTQALPTLTVEYRSIGVNAANLSTGTATVESGGTTVTVSAGLPPNVGLGDRLDLGGGSPETLYVLFSVDATHVTVQTPAAFNHAGETYTIRRAHNTLQAWENALPADLVTANVREVGVAYNDGPFAAGVDFSGSITDPMRSILLTTNVADRQRGTPSSGVVLDNGSNATPAIRISDDHVTIERFEITGGSGTGAHGIEIASVNPANLSTLRYNLIHNTGGDGIRLSDADAIVDVHNNFVFNANVGIRLLADLSSSARVNIFNNTVYNCTTAGVASLDGAGAYARQTSMRVTLRNNIAHSSPVDFQVAKPFDEAYFCTTMSGQDPATCTAITSSLSDQNTNAVLSFTGTNTSCLYLGSTERFRGVGVSLATSGSGANLQWDYWNGTTWTSLETGGFQDYLFQWDGFAYWPDDPSGWATRQGGAGTWPGAPGGAPQRYFVRVCSTGTASSPTERLIVRSDVSVSSRYNLARDKTGLYNSLWRGLGATGVESPAGPVGAGVSFTSATDLHLQSSSIAKDAVLDVQRQDAYLGTPGRESSALSGRFTLDIDLQARPLGANGTCFASPAACWDSGADEVGVDANMDLAIAKDDGQATAVPGNPVTYTITVTNNGPDTVTALSVIEAVPGTLLGPTFAPSTGTYDSGTGEWTGLNLAPTQSATLALSGTIDPFARGTLVNSATVAPPAGGTDPNGTNDSATDTDTLTPSADLGLTKLDDLDPVGLGSVLTYTLAVTNAGPSGATGVTLTDTLPASMLYESATPTQGTCSYVGATRTLTCNLGSIAPSSGVSVTLSVRPRAVGTLVNTASVVGSEPDPAPGNNTATQATTAEVSTVGVRFFTVTSRSETNVLEWVNPTADYVSTEIVYRTDRYPTTSGDGTVLYNGGVAGGQEKLPHPTGGGSNGVTYYYAAFVHLTAPPFVSPGRFCSGRPFDTAGPVKWAFSTGATAVSPPTVGGAGVVAPSNDRILYAMERGPLAPGGEWPGTWWPIELGNVVQSRSPVVPISVGSANPVVFLGAQDGQVYAVDATQGGRVAFLWGPTPVAPMVQAAPAGIFSAFDGTLTFDYLLVGTRDSSGPNAFVALDPATGSVVGSFDNGGGVNGIGIINAMAAVDYPSRRVYFTSHSGGSTTTLWCLQLGPSPTVFSGCGWPTPRTLGDIDSSPVLRGGRVYVGSGANGGTVYSIDAATGDPALDRTFVHGDGQVKGFVFPDRASNDIYFATDDYVWAVTDLAGGMSNKFAGGVSLGVGVRPSPVLFLPGSHYVYVGGSDGKLHEIDVAAGPAQTAIRIGNGQATVGAPSLDRGYSLVHVGTEAGSFYAVETPLPMCVNSCAAKVDDTPCSCYGANPCTAFCVAGFCSDGGGC